MYHFIVNPNTGRKVSIHNKLGKKILENYINYMTGGSTCIGNQKISLSPRYSFHRYTAEEYCTFLYEKYGTCTKQDAWSLPNWVDEMNEMISQYDSNNNNSKITVSTLLSAKFTIQQLKSLNYNISQLKQANVSDESLKNNGYNIKEFKEAEYTNAYLKKLGFTLTEFIECGVNNEDLKKIGFTLSEFKKYGVNNEDLKKLGFTLTEFKKYGVKNEDLKNLGFKPNDFLNIDMPVKIIGELGYTFKEFIESIKDVRMAKRVGYPIEDVKQWHAERRKNGHESDPVILKKEMSEKKMSEKDIFRYFAIADYDPQELKEIGFSLDDFIEFRDDLVYGIEDLQKVVFYKNYWKELDISELKSLGFSLIDLLEHSNFDRKLKYKSLVFNIDELVNSKTNKEFTFKIKELDIRELIEQKPRTKASTSTGQWLDDIKQGYGALYAPIFIALEVNTVDEMRKLSKSQRRGIVGQLTSDDDARRAIRAALRTKDEKAQLIENIEYITNRIFVSRCPQVFKNDNYKLNDLFNRIEWATKYSKPTLIKAGYISDDIVKFNNEKEEPGYKIKDKQYPFERNLRC